MTHINCFGVWTLGEFSCHSNLNCLLPVPLSPRFLCEYRCFCGCCLATPLLALIHSTFYTEPTFEMWNENGKEVLFIVTTPVLALCIISILLLSWFKLWMCMFDWCKTSYYGADMIIPSTCLYAHQQIIEIFVSYSSPCAHSGWTFITEYCTLYSCLRISYL